jgi:polyhydroxyalkanoate synthesis regulator phasin
MMKKILSEAIGNMTKDELKKYVKDLIADEMEKKFTKDKEEEIRNVIKVLMRKHYYNLWQKAPFFIDNL